MTRKKQQQQHTPKIERNIPIPNNSMKWTWCRDMEIGDSAFVPGKTPVEVMNSLRHYRPLKFTSRTERGGTRIWRIK